MSVDNELLNRSDKDISAAQAGDLREARRGKNSSGAEPAAESSDPRSLREAVFQKKREEAKSGLKDKALAAASQPINRGTSKLLQQAWLHLIDSFGATLLWINAHVFLSKVLGEDLFCKLGSEWTPALPGGAGQVGAARTEKTGKMTGIVEVMGLALLDFLLLFVIISLVSLVALILGVISNPLKAIVAVLGYLWNYFKLWK